MEPAQLTEKWAYGIILGVCHIITDMTTNLSIFKYLVQELAREEEKHENNRTTSTGATLSRPQ